MTDEEYSLELPRGWVQARYETATHYHIGYLMKPGSRFRQQWEAFSARWADAKGNEMRIKQEEARRIHQGFGDARMRDAVNRALKKTKARASGVIDIMRLDKILIAENLPPLVSLDPNGFVGKTPGSKKEAVYRRDGVPKEIEDEIEALQYIKDNGPPITETASTIDRGNRDPRIKAMRCFSEWIRWIEIQALESLVENIGEEFGQSGDIAEINVEAILENLR